MTARPLDSEGPRRSSTRHRWRTTVSVGGAYSRSSAASALGSTGHIAAVTVFILAAGEVAGSSALAGAPTAAVVLGAAAGAALLSQVMARRGRQVGLTAGYALGMVGALIATVGVVAVSLPMLLAGMVLIGFGNASDQLSRYAAADMYPRRARRRPSGSSSGRRRWAPSWDRTSSHRAALSRPRWGCRS